MIDANTCIYKNGKQRECSNKRSAKKKNDPKEQKKQKGLFLLGFEPESGVSNPKYSFAQCCSGVFSKFRFALSLVENKCGLP